MYIDFSYDLTPSSVTCVMCKDLDGVIVKASF